MMKKLTGILLALVLVLGLAVSAMADEMDIETGKSTFTVTFTAAKEMDKGYSAEDLSSAVSDMQPGDSVTLDFVLVNASDVGTRWYVNNTITQSLESNEYASNGAYTYELRYYAPGVTVSDTTGTVLYSSDTVGGEDKDSDVDNTDGMMGATDALDEWVALDAEDATKGGTVGIAAGQTAHVTLKIALDGDSQGNSYENAMGKVEIKYAVELTSTSSSPTTPNTPGTGTDIVRTGDSSNLKLAAIIAGASGLLLAALAVWSVKANKKEKKEAGK